MAAYIVIPVIVLTMMAIWFMVYMYDKRLKTTTSSSSPPATASPNVRQEGIVYTISNTPNGGTGNGTVRPSSDLNSATHIRIEPDGRDGVAPPQYGYTSQSLIVVTTIPRDLPPSYDQAIRTTDEMHSRGTPS
ncbi:uncharacterized protein LOC128713276 [Anopheles marshallii]|uniref:uncharacterized protein LOC128713276 n=1 Tax=Anopheles marshallii TaxID=1521116 RepID=UPI00237BF341|nr:uncharacterized protein LOC128713276 [Anopheles marshallii]